MKSHRESILVVDDSPNMLEIIQRNLALKEYKTIYTASCVPEAINLLETTNVDLVITDLKMPGYNGIELVKHVRENYKDTEVLVITGYPSIKDAVETIKLGADEYLIKSFTNEELYHAVENSLKKLAARKIANNNNHDIYKAPVNIIGESEVMQDVYKAIYKAAGLMTTILITGETGTGKEVIARAIHYNSTQSSAPFVAVNCGAIPEDLIESELFGHIKGAFTGAYETRGGFFQTADGGTIFLDEISNTSPLMQVKLLRVLQEKEICMVGSNKPQKVNLRIIAATNINLNDLIAKGVFREDLFYRLNVLSIHVPPLRKRENDILLLVKYFSEKFAKEYKKTPPVFSDEALNVLKNYYWPGNIRELENIYGA